VLPNAVAVMKSSGEKGASIKHDQPHMVVIDSESDDDQPIAKRLKLDEKKLRKLKDEGKARKVSGSSTKSNGLLKFLELGNRGKTVKVRSQHLVVSAESAKCQLCRQPALLQRRCPSPSCPIAFCRNR